MTDTTTDDQDVHMRPFVDWLTELRKGAVAAELTQKLHELVGAVQATGKDGTITLTVKVGVHKKTNALMVDDRVAAKVPAPDRKASLYFVDDDGNLVRNDPNQLSFSTIRAVDSDQTREAKRA